MNFQLGLAALICMSLEAFAVLLYVAPARANPDIQFELGGQSWAIPAAYVEAQSTSSGGPRSVTLQFKLPDFVPIVPGEFKDIPAMEEPPVLSVTLTDDLNILSGQPLLDKLMAKIRKKCAKCGADSSIGGELYSNYADIPMDPKNLTNGEPYALYVNKTPQGDWFAVCYYRPLSMLAAVPLSCERSFKATSSVTVTFKFPREYMGQVFDLESKVSDLVGLMMSANPPAMPAIAGLALKPPSCWVPTPGSSGSKMIPLQVGPEEWHIPAAYVATFGINQTNNPQINGFMIYLKLPNLEPLSPDDPSPFEIRGFGQYIGISFNYQNDAMTRHPTLAKNQNGMVVPAPPWNMPYLGKDAYLPYNDFSFIDQQYLISNLKNSGPTSFPPQAINCTWQSPTENAYCNPQGIEPSIQEDIEKPNQGYMFEYSFSKDYFSILEPISQCVGQLFEAFSGHKLSRTS